MSVPPGVINKTHRGNKNDSSGDASSYNWANELRPSMRKLRQGMDSLCKTSRLICR